MKIPRYGVSKNNLEVDIEFKEVQDQQSDNENFYQEEEILI